MYMYNLIEYGDNHLKTSGNLRQYYTDEPDDDNITDSESYKFKPKITRCTPADGDTRDVE